MKFGYLNREDAMWYNALLMVKDFGDTDTIHTDYAFMTNADTPTLAFNDLIKEPTNPFTGKVVENSMKQQEINELTTPELRERLATEKDRLVTMRLNHAISPLENPQSIKAQRRDIARLMTELRKREMNENK
jgi:large subunit ribosomal protein L29